MKVVLDIDNKIINRMELLNNVSIKNESDLADAIVKLLIMLYGDKR